MNIKHTLAKIIVINISSFIDGLTNIFNDEKIKKEETHNIDHALHSSPCGKRPTRSNLLFADTTAHSEVEINPKRLLAINPKITKLRKVIRVL